MADYIKGLWVKKPSPKAPDFIKAKVSFKVEDFITTLKDSKEEWFNVEIKESKEGNLYAEVDTWKPNSSTPEPIDEEENDTSLPF